MAWAATTFKARWEEFANSPRRARRGGSGRGPPRSATSASSAGSSTTRWGLLAAHKLSISPFGQQARLNPKARQGLAPRDHALRPGARRPRGAVRRRVLGHRSRAVSGRGHRPGPRRQGDAPARSRALRRPQGARRGAGGCAQARGARVPARQALPEGPHPGQGRQAHHRGRRRRAGRSTRSSRSRSSMSSAGGTCPPAASSAPPSTRRRPRSRPSRRRPCAPCSPGR
jgi:hypothetical protein